MVAAYKGFLPIVYELHGCPHLDINHQDNDGNTALMIAAQAGQLLHVWCQFTVLMEIRLDSAGNNSAPAK